MSSLRLSIIIVNWNTRDLLEQCLRSVMPAIAGMTAEVIVVDNASRDDSAAMAQRLFPSVRVIGNAENTGFARANNQAIGLASGEYILLLNPDTVIGDAGLFTAWTDFMDRTPAACASGCRLVFSDGRHQVGDAGYRPCPAAAACFAFFLSKLFPGRCRGMFVQNGRLRQATQVDWVCGAGLLARRSALDRVGLLDESLFMYAEDVEWGCRMRECGFKVYYLPFLQIIHLQRGSAKQAGSQGEVSVTWLDNLRAVYLKCNPGRSLLAFDCLLGLGYCLRAALYFGRFLCSGQRHFLRRAREMRHYGRHLLFFKPGTRLNVTL